VLAALLSRYGYTLIVAFTSAMLTFPFGFFRSSPQEVINQLFGSAHFELTARWANPSIIVNLVIFTVCKFVFTCIAVGCPISCGVYTPVFLIGAAGGRCFGETLNMLTPESYPITAGGYAVVGAAAMAAGVTRTISTAVIVFELTGQLNHMLPVLVAVLIATAVGNSLNASVYDTMMQLNNLPYLRPLPYHTASRHCAQDVMDTSVLALACPCTYMDARTLLRQNRFNEFPVVDASGHLIGSVRRSTLDRLIEQILHNPQRRAAEMSISDKMREAWRRKAHSFKGIGTRLSELSSLSRATSRSWSSCPTSAMAPIEQPPDSATAVAAEQRPQPHSEGASEWIALSKATASPLSGANSEEQGAGMSTSAIPSVTPSAIPSGEMSSTGTQCNTEEGSSPRACSSPETIGAAGADAPFRQEADAAVEASSSAACPAEQDTQLTDAERGLLELQLDLGVSELMASFGGRPGGALINIAPTVVLAGTSLQQVHMQFSLFSTEHAYVTFAGRYLGVIRRAHLTGQE